MRLHFCEVFVFIVTIFICISAEFNHPELRWKSVSTEHFIINYDDALEPLVYPTWKIAEEVYRSICKAYGYAGKNKINISLVDYDDYSNGWAEWTASNILICTPDNRFELRGNTTWLRNVITHELTHIVSLESKKKRQLLAITPTITLESPDESYVIQEPFARITLYPSWLSEGIAQLETENQGNDCWDTRRDMVLRCAALDDKLLTLDEMGHFNHTGLGNEMVYNQGFSLTKHIERTIGSAKLRELFRKGSQERVAFESYFTEFTGYSLRKMYDQWRDSLKNYSKMMIPEKVAEEKVIASNGTYNVMPKISPDGKHIAYFSSGKDDGSRTDLYVKEISSGKILIKEPHAHTALAFSSQSDRIFFVKSRAQNWNGSYYNDIFSKDISSGKGKRITWDARVYDIAPTSDGKEIVCIRYKDNAFVIDRLNLESGVYKRVIDGQPGEPFVNVCIDPFDQRQLLVTKIIEGKSRLFRFNGSDLLPFGPAMGQEESPFISTNARIYYSADYDGIFNIYSVDSNGSDLIRHTNVSGGYFSPIVSADGKLVVSKFRSGGFSVVQIVPEAIRYEIDTISTCKFKPLPVPKGKVVIKSHPYQGNLLRSTWELEFSGVYQTNRSLLTQQYIPEIDTSTMQIAANLQSVKSDALHKKFLALNFGCGFLTDLSEDDKSKKASFSGLKSSLENDYFNKRNGFIISGNNKKNLFVKNMIRESQSESENSDSTEPIKTIPITFSGVAFGSELGVLDISAGVQAIMAMIIYPVLINTQLQIGYQITRELNYSIAVNSDWQPLSKLSTFQLPMALSWSSMGYYNEDINYNYSDVANISMFFIPEYFPKKVKEVFVKGKIEAKYETVNSFRTGAQLLYSIPLLKYSPLQISGDVSMMHYDRKMILSVDTGKFQSGSLNYYSFGAGANYVFPIIRTVNKKFGYYWDALYGSAGYSLTLLADNSFFEKKAFCGELFRNYDYSKNAFVEHVISANLEFGHTKEYLFDKKLNVNFNYEIFKRKTSIDIVFGF